MDISKTLIEAVKNGNTSAIHSVMYTIAHEDPAFKTTKFEDNLKYIEEHYRGDLYDIEQESFKDKAHWTGDYWAEVVSGLMDTFSRQRITHLKEVGQYVYGQGSIETDGTPSQEMDCEKEIIREREMEFSWTKWCAIAVVGIIALYKLARKGKII